MYGDTSIHLPFLCQWSTLGFLEVPVIHVSNVIFHKSVEVLRDVFHHQEWTASLKPEFLMLYITFQSVHASEGNDVVMSQVSERNNK